TELAEVRPGMQAIDLFSGLGGIGLALARAGATVIAVEIDRDAVAQLRRAAQHANLPLTAIAGDVGEVRGQLGARPDVVVVNPPRKGLSAGARAFLAELTAPVILYVSCGPDALGRDLNTLAGYGYTPDVIEPFDLMPGTAQIETIVRLRKPLRVARRGQRSA
ncbi:MAG TPA: RsmD family RNA methyltransferase, partial [Kofleriaceae bacterium]|nr:RsmD family RNA methyltransferase [Kofleriaceae bacterium]